eukprot:TRINITY_DN9695_c0_g1_i2.p4 TRINITY_DN9695_c0_g1~~TRINITY_DN9695_c0_g1_i2.p4  ORF type:complete len:162 (+),score=31.47 TRINITY_DN9695_c0_g1_i2:200-685(+)
METKLKTLMKDSISDVLSGMFFSPVEFSDDFAPEEINDFLKIKNIIIARILVEGEYLLEIYAAVRPETMEELTLSFTGKANAARADVEGSLMEMLNMAGGEIVADFFKSRETRLHIPQICSESDFLDSLSDKNTEKIPIRCNLIDGELFIVGLLRKPEIER